MCKANCKIFAILKVLSYYSDGVNHTPSAQYMYRCMRNLNVQHKFLPRVGDTIGIIIIKLTTNYVYCFIYSTTNFWRESLGRSALLALRCRGDYKCQQTIGSAHIYHVISQCVVSSIWISG